MRIAISLVLSWYEPYLLVAVGHDAFYLDPVFVSAVQEKYHT